MCLVANELDAGSVEERAPTEAWTDIVVLRKVGSESGGHEHGVQPLAPVVMEFVGRVGDGLIQVKEGLDAWRAVSAIREHESQVAGRQG